MVRKTNALLTYLGLVAWGAGAAGCGGGGPVANESHGDSGVEVGDGGSLDVTDAGLREGAAETSVPTSDSSTPEANSADGADACSSCGENVVLFGGWGAQQETADTWAWNGTSWSIPTPGASTPSARDHATAAAAAGNAMLFGGFWHGNALGDTWVCDGMNWAQQNVTGPSGRWGAAAASLNGTAVLFGGVYFDGGFFEPLGDTWEWTGTAWGQLGASAPTARGFAAAAALNGKMMLFGGTTSPNEISAASLLGDTWEWDGTGWTQQNVVSPSPRYGAAAATLQGSKILLFGGANVSGVLGDTWEWDGNIWIQLGVSGPSARYGSSAATEPSGNVVLFGGSNELSGDGEEATGTLGDTWEWNGATWAQLSVQSPSARFGAAISPL
jgi:hypothetical protein